MYKEFMMVLHAPIFDIDKCTKYRNKLRDVFFTNNNYILPISYNPGLIEDFATEKDILFMSKIFIYRKLFVEQRCI